MQKNKDKGDKKNNQKNKEIGNCLRLRYYETLVYMEHKFKTTEQQMEKTEEQLRT